MKVKVMGLFCSTTLSKEVNLLRVPTSTAKLSSFEKLPKSCSGGQDRRSFHCPGSEPFHDVHLYSCGMSLMKWITDAMFMCCVCVCACVNTRSRPPLPCRVRVCDVLSTHHITSRTLCNDTYVVLSHTT